MSTNLNTQLSTPRGITGEGWAAIAGALGSAFLLAKKLLGPKPTKPDVMSRADFYAEMLEVRDRMQANHLALLEKLDSNHRELLAALERQLSASPRWKQALPAWTSARSTVRVRERVEGRKDARLPLIHFPQLSTLNPQPLFHNNTQQTKGNIE